MKIVKKVRNNEEYKKAIKAAKKLQSSAEKGLKKEMEMQARFNEGELSKTQTKKLVEIVKQNYKIDELKIEQYKAIEKYRNQT